MTHAKFKLLAMLACSLMIVNCQLEQLAPSRVAHGSARLTVLTTGALLGALQIDSKCGFESLPSIKNAKTKKTYEKNGEDFGYVEMAAENCKLHFPEETVISTDCNNIDTIVKGTVTISAKQRRHGILTNIDYQPIIPQGDSPVEFEIEKAEFDNFTAYFSSAPSKNLRIISGELKASASVHLAKDKDTKMNSIAIPNITFSNIEYTKTANVILSGDGRTFPVTINNGKLSAQVGEAFIDKKVDENTLYGSMVVWNNTVQIPTDGAGLDPDYTKEEFRSSYVCEYTNVDTSLTPKKLFDTNLNHFLAHASAKLLFLNTAGILAEASREKNKWTISPGCGFASTNNAIWNARKGDAEDTLVVSVDTCTIGSEDAEPYDTGCNVPKEVQTEFISFCKEGCEKRPQANMSDCLESCKKEIAPTNSFMNGYVEVTGIATTPGMLDIYEYRPSTLPRISPLETSIKLEKVAFNRDYPFSFYLKREDEKYPKVKLELHSGALSANAQPHFTTGIDEIDDCTFSEATPILEVSDLKANEIEAIIELKLPSPLIRNAEGLYEPSVKEDDLKTKQFKFKINAASLHAMNGHFNGKGNFIYGFVKVNGEKLSIPEQKLDENHHPALFEASYTCGSALPLTNELLQTCETHPE